MRRKFVISDPEKCIGCKICEYVCSAEKEGVFNPLLSRIRAVRIPPTVNIAVTCRLCEDPPCVQSCPRKALDKDENTGLIMVDEERCDGCGWCIEACEFGAIMLHPDKKTVLICDLCDGDPKCVQCCPVENALSYTTIENISQSSRRKTISLRLE